MANTPRRITHRARALRRSETPAEERLWSRLRNRRLVGFKFVRQEPVGPFVVDFVCREAMLAIEVDGATHSTDAEVSNDKRREEHLTNLGYRVARFTNDEVYHQLEGVLETILSRLERQS